MGNIYFAPDLEIRVWKAIKEAYDCADVKNDLDRIQWALQFGTDEQAGFLDMELRQKYPTIHGILQAANRFPTQPQLARPYEWRITTSFEKSNLKQDYWGILCDTAVKKGIKKRLEDCIDHVETV